VELRRKRERDSQTWRARSETADPRCPVLADMAAMALMLQYSHESSIIGLNRSYSDFVSFPPKYMSVLEQ
jgi:hypothetical protein